MASIIDGYCCLKTKSKESKWVKIFQSTSTNRLSFEKYSLSEKISMSDSQELNKSISKYLKYLSKNVTLY